MPSKTILIIPCYNESNRLPLREFLQVKDIHFLFVDDGSSDGTAALLEATFGASRNCEILNLAKNSGKAEAVRQGMLSLLQKDLSDVEWLGFWDADLSTALSEVSNFLTFQQIFAPEAKSIWGSRVYRLGASIKRSPLRHYLGRVFATIIAHALKIEAYDTQCGAKLFRTEMARKAFSEPFISRWIFDLEILLRIGQADVVEYPVIQWTDVPGSKVKVARESFRVLKDIFKIRRKYLG